MTRRRDKFTDKPKKEYDEVLLEVRRVTRVTTGGRQLSFRAIILVGNRKGSIGVGVAKGSDVQIAVAKATHDAYKHLVKAPITDEGTIPYQVTTKYKAAMVKLIPAAAGTGLKAGSSVRMVLELTGYTNMLSKIVGSQNKLNNALATIAALGAYKQGKFPERAKKSPEPQSTEETPEASTEKKAPEEKKPTTAAKPKKDTKVTPKTKEVKKVTKKPEAQSVPAKKTTQKSSSSAATSKSPKTTTKKSSS